MSDFGILPAPYGDGEEMERWRWSALVRRILYGRWDADLRERIRLLVGPVRESAWGGKPDLSANLCREVYEEMSCLYDSAPTVSHPSQPAQDRMAAALRDAMLWPMMQRVQRDTLGQREGLVRVDVDSDGRPMFRQVFPDCAIAQADPDDPTRPVWLREARLRVLDGKDRWCWDEIDIRDPAAPSYRIVTVEANPKSEKDVTGKFLPAGPYPYLWADGTPLIPYVLYHATATGRLWDPWGNREVVEGTLNLGVYYTYWSHILRTCSYPQRWTINAMPAGMNTSEQKQAEVAADPAMVLALEAIDSDSGQPTVGQWNPGADPVEFLSALGSYEQRLVSKAGVKAAGATRADGSPKSGYAISLSLEEKRGVQRRVEPQFSAGDRELAGKTAALMNAYGAGLPEDGWEITYSGIPLSAEERDAARRDVIERINAGLMDPVDAYVELNPGTTREAAAAALDSFRQSRVRFGIN